MVTTDGTITDIPRSNYIDAEERVVRELRELGKPFIIILNSRTPKSEEAQSLQAGLEEKYQVPVLAIDVMNLTDEDVDKILSSVLFEFPD